MTLKHIRMAGVVVLLVGLGWLAFAYSQMRPTLAFLVDIIQAVYPSE